MKCVTVTAMQASVVCLGVIPAFLVMEITEIRCSVHARTVLLHSTVLEKKNLISLFFDILLKEQVK